MPATLRALTIAVLAVGCVPPVPVLTQPRRAPALDDDAPVARLGRWDGSRFVEVTPGSVPPSHVHVLVHGWAPGWSDEARAEPDRPSWQTEGFEPWVGRVAAALSEADPHAVVLAYSWLDDAATSRFVLAQRAAWSCTDRQGHLLSRAIDDALAPGFVDGAGRVHLVGHSYGARVATIAALDLANPDGDLGAPSTPKAARQLTLLDAPDGSMTHLTGGQSRLAPLLAKLRIGSGPGETFVDNYVSMVGLRYGGPVLDVSLTPPFHAFDYRRRHLYPLDFYVASASRDFGIGWSPMVARSTPTARCYHQPYGRVAVEPGCESVF